MAPTVRSSSAELEPLTLLESCPAAYPGLLESGVGMAAGLGSRFDILAMANGESLRLASDGRLSGPHAGRQGFLAALENWWTALRLPEAASPLPFTGGWLLYLGYELAAEIEPRLILPLSLSYDHRLIDGADAARFLRWVAEAFEQPFLLSVQG